MADKLWRCPIDPKKGFQFLTDETAAWHAHARSLIGKDCQVMPRFQPINWRSRCPLPKGRVRPRRVPAAVSSGLP